MTLRIAITVLVVACAAALLYHCRALTFAIWTNAAMLDQAHPIATVAAIETVLLGMLSVGAWFLVGFLLPAAQLIVGSWTQ